MRHKQYLKLYPPKKISVTSDPEGPTVDAVALKIMHSSSLDELHETAFIDMAYCYGFINSKGEFKQIGNMMEREVVIDIPDIMSAEHKSTGEGRNLITGRFEKAGSWLTDVLNIDTKPTDRVEGDFRIADLYTHLRNKYGIQGELCNV